MNAMPKIAFEIGDQRTFVTAHENRKCRNATNFVFVWKLGVSNNRSIYNSTDSVKFCVRKKKHAVKTTNHHKSSECSICICRIQLNNVLNLDLMMVITAKVDYVSRCIVYLYFGIFGTFESVVFVIRWNFFLQSFGLSTFGYLIFEINISTFCLSIIWNANWLEFYYLQSAYRMHTIWHIPSYQNTVHISIVRVCGL